MAEKRTCCPESSARNVRKIDIGGCLIGISQLDEVIDQVVKLGIEEENALRKELLKRVRIYNYVPSDAEKEYEAALLKEYFKKRERR
ncbi:MAG: hypothetical protein QXN93_07480 [Methanomassiliicoccales archaeon]